MGAAGGSPSAPAHLRADVSREQPRVPSGRGAQTAIDEATKYLSEGFNITVDIDLSKFFDRVHHQRLLSRLAQRVADGRILKLVHRMLKAKVVLPDGARIATEEGTPQGGPLSPLLSNIVLDELDWELAPAWSPVRALCRRLQRVRA